MMKGGGGGYFYQRRRKKLLLLFIGVVFTTIAVWSWEKTPILTSLFPSHGQLFQLFPAGEVAPFKDDLREEAVNLVSPSSSFLDTRENKQIVNLMSPTSSPFLDTREKKQDVDSVSSPLSSVNTPSLEKHHENTTTMVEKPVSSEVSNRYHDSKPPKQHINEQMSPKKPDSSDGSETTTINVEKQGCNFGKGKWVRDEENRPFYSGFGCKQWLSGMWACRLTQRTDFGYEKLKWQPKDCQMDDFTPLKFLKRMQHKTLAFVGDSLGRQQFQSLMCMLTGGEETHNVQDVGKEYGLVKARGSVRPDGWAYRFQKTNTTILYYWSASLCDLQPLDPTNRTTSIAMHLDQPPYFLKHFIGGFHVLVLNTGHHWNRGKLNANRWIMYVDGKPNTNRKLADISGAKNFTIHSIVKWVDGELRKRPFKAFYRSISPRHFFNGDWNSGGTCDSTTPGTLEVEQNESSDLLAAGAVKGTKVKLLDITGLSQVREEGHISRYSIRATPGMQDCLHWCLPGIPDTWNEVLFAQI